LYNNILYAPLPHGHRLWLEDDGRALLVKIAAESATGATADEALYVLRHAEWEWTSASTRASLTGE
jgi:hypothetical protein